ncbi:hypothetical protein I4U23_004758 [Adineta vaga]|nr:hypothetical protein I4U23_004758 [Adineta vaga]
MNSSHQQQSFDESSTNTQPTQSQVFDADDEIQTSVTESVPDQTEGSPTLNSSMSQSIDNIDTGMVRPIVGIATRSDDNFHTMQSHNFDGVVEQRINIAEEGFRHTTNEREFNSTIEAQILVPIEPTTINKKKNNFKRTSGSRLGLTFHIIVNDEPEENSPSVSINSTELNYYGQNIPVNVDNLRNAQILGYGNFGVVHAVILDEQKEIIPTAVKCIARKRDKDGHSSANNELEILQTISSSNHPYIIDYYGAMINSVRIDTTTDHLCIWMELMDASMKDFYVAMHSPDGDGTTNAELEFVIRRVTHNITSGLQFLETKQILHRDVKPANMLIKKDNIVVKLCDFNICCSMLKPELLKGSVSYIPPIYEQQATQNDMWALGISLLEIIVGKHPHADWTQSDEPSFDRLLCWDRVVPETVSSPMQKLVLHLLQNVAEERPGSYSDILNYLSTRQMISAPSEDDYDFVRRVFDNISPIGIYT